MTTNKMELFWLIYLLDIYWKILTIPRPVNVKDMGSFLVKFCCLRDKPKKTR